MPLVLNDSLTPYTIVTFANRAIDVPGASTEDGKQIQQWDRNLSPAQLWYFDPCGNGDQVRIINRASGRVLDITDGGPAGTRLQQYAWAANDNQRWKIEDAGKGQVTIASFARPDLVIDVGGANPDNEAPIIVWNRNGQANQRFTLVKV